MKLTIAKDELQFGHKQTLNKDFWKDEKLDVEVRLAIMAIVKNFLKTTNLEMTADEIDEIEFTGSLANYNYGKYSDVDIHLLFDFSKIGDDPEFMRDYLTTKAINWNNRHNVTIFGHEVELYITDAGSDHHSTGVYSVKDDKWLVKPVRDTKLSAELNLNKVKDKADKISKEIDMLVSVEGDLSLETIEGLKNKIKKMRVAGLETGGEFSIENLAFKLLRRRGELNTLYALMNQAQDAELSLDEDVEWWKKRRKKDNKNYRELMGYGKKKGVFKKKYAFKNVGKKNKLNRMSGAPYMINPQMKLPKSGPPGVGSLEEQYSQGTISTLNKVINKLDSGEPVEMKLTDMTLSGFECLGPHSYTLKKSGDSYSIKLKQSVSSILSQQAKTMKGAGDFKPLEKCVYKAGDGIIDDVELKDIILDQLSAGKAEFVFVAPKLPTFKQIFNDRFFSPYKKAVIPFDINTIINRKPPSKPKNITVKHGGPVKKTMEQIKKELAAKNNKTVVKRPIIRRPGIRVEIKQKPQPKINVSLAKKGYVKIGTKKCESYKKQELIKLATRLGISTENKTIKKICNDIKLKYV